MARIAEASPLDCSICLSVPDEQVHQCRNGHLFCADCLAAHRSSGQQNSKLCPQCRVTLPKEPIRCLLAEQQIAAQPSACPHCNVAMTRGEISAHVEQCPQRPVICSAEACAWQGTAAECEAHEQACVHVVCGRMLKERDEQWQAQIATLREEHRQSIASMQKESLKRRLEEQCLSAYRDCARHPPGSGFRVEIVRPDADMTADGFCQSSKGIEGTMHRLLCQIPGPAGTDWDGGCFPLLIDLLHEYPMKPPKCRFPAREGPGQLRRPPIKSAARAFNSPLAASLTPAFFHSNVYPSGKVELSTLREDLPRNCTANGWHPSFTIAEILISVQLLLNNPNNADPAQWQPYALYTHAREEHDARVRAQAANYTAEAFEDLVRRHCIRGTGGEHQGWTADGQHRVVRGMGG